jgi:hypothetical protein
MTPATRARLQELVEEAHAKTVRMFGSTMSQQTADYMAECLLAACLAAEGEPEPQGWQSIETAPRDGTQILIWIVGIEPRPRIAYWADRGMEYGWFGLQSQHLLGVPVTHWMPLPVPPVASPASPEGEEEG